MKKLIILAIFALCFFSVSAHAADVTLSWTAPADPRVTGYNVYVGTELATIGDNLYTSTTETSAVIADRVEAQGYYFGATSTDAELNESAMSDVIHYTIDAPGQVIEIPGRPGSITIQFGE